MNEIIKLSNTTLVVTFRCNLKCKLCAVSAPYYKEPPHYSVELLKKSIDRYFEAVDHVDKFTVNGGEPLVHPQIAEIMDYALKYIDRMDMLEIITNGSIAPSKELAQVLQKSEKAGKTEFTFLKNQKQPLTNALYQTIRKTVFTPPFLQQQILRKALYPKTEATEFITQTKQKAQ